MSQIWCRDQDFELLHDEIHCIMEKQDFEMPHDEKYNGQ